MPTVNRLVHSLNSAVYPRLPIFAQNAACTVGGWLRYRARFNGHFRRRLAEWEDTGQSSLEELHEIQRRRLDRLVEVARRNVPYYRDLPPPSEKKDPLEAMHETLAGIPPLHKRAYRDQPAAFLSRDVPRRRLRRGQTSGTTGTALPLWHTPETLAEEYATVWRLRRRWGVDIRDPYLSFAGQIIVPFGQTRPPFWRRNAYGAQVLFSIYHMTPLNLRAYVEAVHELPARYVQGYPSSIHIVARALLESGRPLPKGRCAAVFTSSESLLAFQRKTIEKAFGAPILDRYGASEFAVSMTQCEAGRLHVDMEFCIVEMEVEQETADSETGPLLITGLGQDATPFFRYRIGDVGTRAKTPCPCGRAGDSFLEVDGRIEDYVLTPDGRLVGRMDHAFKEQLDVAEAQIVQNDKESIELMIVPGATYSEASQRSVLRSIRSRLGNDIQVRIQLVSSIPREPNGKFRAVKSKVGRNAP
jgi:phenylacetate-CoA ligase